MKMQKKSRITEKEVEIDQAEEKLKLSEVFWDIADLDNISLGNFFL